MKKFTACLTALVLCLLIFIVPAAASSGSCGTAATYTLENGVLTITGQGETTNYTRDGNTDQVNNPWWNERSSITSVVVSEGITVLNNYAFYDCTNLTSVQLPQSLTKINARVFAKCSSLTSITFPKKLSFLGLEACVGSGLTDITFEGNAPKVSTTPPLTGLSATVHYGNDPAFLTTEFGGQLEFQTTAEPDNSPDPAEDVDMSNPEKEGMCGPNASWAFKKGTLLITGTGETEKYVRNEDLDTVQTPWWEWRDQIKTLVVGKGISRVNNYLMFRCEKLEKVTLASSVVAINYGAFKECKALKELTLPKNLAEIGSQAFALSGIKKLTFKGPIPTDIGDLMADGLTATFYYPCTEPDVSNANVKIFGGDLKWVKTHNFENGKCTLCGVAEANVKDDTAEDGKKAAADKKSLFDGFSMSAVTIVSVCLTVLAVAALAFAFVLILKSKTASAYDSSDEEADSKKKRMKPINPKHRKTLLIVLPVVAGILIATLTLNVVISFNQPKGNSSGGKQMLVIKNLPGDKEGLKARVLKEISTLKSEGREDNDSLTELFTACDASGYIHTTQEGTPYITAKDGGQIMLSELSSTYVHRMTAKTFSQILEVGDTYVANAQHMRYGNYYTPFNEKTTNHIDCSSFVQSVLYGIPYDTSRFVKDEAEKMHDFGFTLPDNPYSNMFGPKRYLANELGRYAFDNNFAFYPESDGTDGGKLQPGDIVFFSTNKKNEDYFLNITHIAIFVKYDEQGRPVILHGNSYDVVNYYTIDLTSDLTPLGSKNPYKNALVLIGRFPVTAD